MGPHLTKYQGKCLHFCLTFNKIYVLIKTESDLSKVVAENIVLDITQPRETGTNERYKSWKKKLLPHPINGVENIDIVDAKQGAITQI